MGDEERRRLEREARYDAGLTALLTCLRDGHDPVTVPAPARYAAGTGDGGATVRFAVYQHAVGHSCWIVPCKRCGLIYWLPYAPGSLGAEADQRERARQAAEAQERLREAERQAWLDNAERSGAGYRGPGRP